MHGWRMVLLIWFRTFVLCFVGFFSDVVSALGALIISAIAVPVHQQTRNSDQKPMVVFQPGLPGLEGYSSFRIPAIVYHNNELLAFCEGRKESHRDSGPIDIVLRRGRLGIIGEEISVDWKGLEVIIPADKHYRAMNACPIVDKERGHIVLVYVRFPVNKTESQQIVCKTYDQEVCCIMSRDNGRRWSSPTNITDVLDQMKPKPLLYAPGPGHGIQLEKTGRLIVSGNIQYKTPTRWPRVHSLLSKVAPFIGADGRACLIYSDDHGKSWQAGATIDPAPYLLEHHLYANESQVAELSDGRLYINSRTRQPNRNRQGVCCSSSGEITSGLEETTLYEPSGIPRALAFIIPNCYMIGGCEGSVISLDHPGNLSAYDDSQEKVLVFSNPASESKRANLSLRVSLDVGQSWTDPLSIHMGPSAYSDLVAFGTRRGMDEMGVAKSYIGCLYECGDTGQYAASKIVISLIDSEAFLSTML